MTFDLGFFVPHFFISVDLGVPAIVGAETLAVYDVYRRHVCRDDRQRRSGRLAALYARGHLVCCLSQSELAHFLEYSDRHVRRYTARLREFGWIEHFGYFSPQSSIPIYRLGRLVSARGKQGCTESFYADEWLHRAKLALTKYARKSLKDPDASYRDLPTKERIAFVRQWVERENAARKKMLRPSGEDAKPATGDDEPDGRSELSLSRIDQISKLP